jgi:hypothetical protein
MRWLSSFLCALVGLGAGTVAAAGPHLVVPAASFDFGAVERGTRVDHVFRVRNDGDASATILGIDRTCACTVGATNTRVLAPGQDLWVSVGLETHALAGAVAKAVTLHTDDPQAQTLRLVVQGTVLKDLVADPPTLYVGEVWRGSEVERSASLRSARPAGTARVVAAQARGPFVVPRLLDDGAGGLRITVRVADDAPAGRFRDEIVVRGVGPDATVILPVLGVVRTGDDASSRDVVARAGDSVRR